MSDSSFTSSTASWERGLPGGRAEDARVAAELRQARRITTRRTGETLGATPGWNKRRKGRSRRGGRRRGPIETVEVDLGDEAAEDNDDLGASGYHYDEDYDETSTGSRSGGNDGGLRGLGTGVATAPAATTGVALRKGRDTILNALEGRFVKTRHQLHQKKQTVFSLEAACTDKVVSSLCACVCKCVCVSE